MTQAALLEPEIEPTESPLTPESWGKLGMWIFLAGDAMSFGALLAGYGALRSGSANWPHPSSVLGVGLTAVMTFLLICSSVTMVLALAGIQRLAQHLDTDTVPAATQVLRQLDKETVPAATQLLARVQQLAANFEKTSDAGRLVLEQVNSSLDDGSPLRYQLDLTLRELTSASRSFRMLASSLEQNPDSVIFGKRGK